MFDWLRLVGALADYGYYVVVADFLWLYLYLRFMVLCCGVIVIFCCVLLHVFLLQFPVVNFGFCIWLSGGVWVYYAGWLVLSAY